MSRNSLPLTQSKHSLSYIRLLNQPKAHYEIHTNSKDTIWYLMWFWPCIVFNMWCPKHVEQAIRSAIKTSVASSWHFISTYYLICFGKNIPSSESTCGKVKTRYLLTPWSTALLEKLTGSAASQEIPRLFETWRFSTVLTSDRHLSLSWANSIQSTQPLPTSWRSILISSSRLRLGSPQWSPSLRFDLFPSGLVPFPKV